MKVSHVIMLATAAAAAPTPAAKDHYGNHNGEYWKGKGGYEPSPAAPAVTDAQILNYALTLEHLEDKFYREGLANFSEADFENYGFDATFYGNLQEVSRDESTHVAFLTGALQAAGYAAVAECTYNFGILNPATFIATASVLEGVGVSAYLGAAASIMNKAYLTAAGSILTVESRHSSYLRASIGESPFPSPFDIPLDFDEVYTLAAPFIVSCPASNPPLPVKAFPSLAVGSATTMPIHMGQNIYLTTPGTKLKENKPIYAAFITVTGPVFTDATPGSDGKSFEVTVPTTQLVAGQTYCVLTYSNSTVTDDTVIAGPAIVEVLPAYKA